jgi:hypothetical protein
LRNPVAAYRRRRLLRDLAPQCAAVERYLEGRAEESAEPVLFFNASTRIHTLSLNGAFALLAAWAVRAAGQPVLHLVCQSGMTPCVLGTNRAAPEAAPPCKACLDLSRALIPAARTIPLAPGRSAVEAARSRLRRLPLQELIQWEEDGLPLGAMVLPSVRWILRRHRLPDSDQARGVFTGYLASAVGLAVELRRILAERHPRALVVFNGVFYPEAVARRLAMDMGIPVVTHEVGLRPLSAFFSHRQATFREVEIPEEFTLPPDQEAELDDVLARRFRGEFTMAGIRFWPEMEGLPRRVTEKRPAFDQMATVFTNVAFDTSQVHANVLFEDMFDWLSRLAEVFRQQARTLFVVRAHPDESRRGKESRESVAAWIRNEALDRLDNLVFVGPDEAASSYELIRSSKFVLVYNSSVGLEATILGTPALCAGRARFTQIEATYTPDSPEAYWRLLQEFLGAQRLAVPETQVRRARAFLHTEWFRASLDLGEYLTQDAGRPGMVRFSRFDPSRLADSEVARILRAGILDGRPFLAGAGHKGGGGGHA